MARAAQKRFQLHVNVVGATLESRVEKVLLTIPKTLVEGRH